MKPKKQFDHEDAEKNKVIAALSYVGILCVIPVFLKKESKFIEKHAKQGVALFLAEIMAWFLNIIPIIGTVFFFMLSILFVGISIIAIMKTLQGDFWEIPVINQYSKKINL